MSCDNCAMVSCQYCCFKDNYTEHDPDLIRNTILTEDVKEGEMKDDTKLQQEDNPTDDV